MVTLKDVIIDSNISKIELRSFNNFGEDVLCGYYLFEDGELKVLDGDILCLEEGVCGFEICDDGDGEPLLLVWITSVWLEDNDTNKEVLINNKYEAQMLKKYLAANREDTFEAKVKYLESLR